MENKKADYRALLTAGKIRSFADLMTVFRNETIDTYNSAPSWPTYAPTEKDKVELGRICSMLDIAAYVPFSAFVQIFNSRVGVSV